MKTRKVKIETLASKEAEIRKKYGIGGEEIKKDKPITIELWVPDTSETLKSLTSDPDILNWSDCELDADVDTTFREKTLKLLKTVDLSDMKSVIRLCLGLKEVMEYRKDEKWGPTAIIFDTLRRTWDNDIPFLPEELIKDILRAMASGKKIFSEKLYKSMEKTLSSEIPAITPEAFLKMIFVDNYAKE